jgi:D-glycero-D-manno-heptose 1,7-bisphosphate phosphatase
MSKATTPAVFLDRDGVINESLVRNGRPYAPTHFAEFSILPGVCEALLSLKKAGYRLIVVTNQPDLAKGSLPPDELEKMHSKMLSTLPIDDVRVCPHIEEDGCSCRKPKPGMLIDAARELSLDLKKSFMVGDRWRDIDAGKAAGCKTVLIGDGYGERPIVADATVTSLLEASRLILNFERN